MDDEFVGRFGVVGDVAGCTDRLLELVSLGLDRLVVTGPSIDADREQARLSGRLVRDELLPALRAEAS
jgi:hypothetical protein